MIKVISDEASTTLSSCLAEQVKEPGASTDALILGTVTCELTVTGGRESCKRGRGKRMR